MLVRFVELELPANVPMLASELDSALRLGSAGWNAYFTQVYPSGSCVREGPGSSAPDRSRVFYFFFYLDRIPKAARPQHGPPPLLGLSSQATKNWSSPFSDFDAYRAAVLDGGGRVWSGRRPGESYHLMCTEGSAGLWPRPGEAAAGAASRARASLWAYPYDRDAAAQGAFPVGGHPSHARVEVFHCAERSPAAAEDYWMYLATGSGIFFDLGRTIAFRDRLELFVSTNATSGAVVHGTGHGCWFTGRRHMRLSQGVFGTSGY
eukprot:4550722-Prymnesium_polylepis.1